jgi:hypothetical protein
VFALLQAAILAQWVPARAVLANVRVRCVMPNGRRRAPKGVHAAHRVIHAVL